MKIHNSKICALRVDAISKEFKGKAALNQISFSVKQGEILGIIGANGAGKTTLLKCLLSVLRPNAGKIFYFDQELQAQRSKILKRVGFASTYTSLPFFLTVKENLEFSSKLFIGSYDPHRAQELLNLLGANELYHRRFSSLSAGEKTKVMIVRAYVHNPAIVFLDEPTASLDFETAAAVRNFVSDDSAKKGTTVLLTSHNLSEVEKLTDSIIVIQKGAVITSGSTKEIFGGKRTCRIKTKLTTPLISFTHKVFDDGSIEFDLEKDKISDFFKEYGGFIDGTIDITESPIEELVRDLLHNINGKNKAEIHE